MGVLRGAAGAAGEQRDWPELGEPLRGGHGAGDGGVARCGRTGRWQGDWLELGEMPWGNNAGAVQRTMDEAVGGGAWSDASRRTGAMSPLSG